MQALLLSLKECLLLLFFFLNFSPFFFLVCYFPVFCRIRIFAKELFCSER